MTGTTTIAAQIAAVFNSDAASQFGQQFPNDAWAAPSHPPVHPIPCDVYASGNPCGGIAKFDDGKHVRYLNFGGKFLDEHGNLPKNIMYDYLHLTPAGYKSWADAILPSLEEMLKQ